MITVTADFIRDNFEDFAWRHHGAGLLQASIDARQRIHIWHPDLLLDGMREGGAVHNHRFGIRSRVHYGVLHQSRLSPVPFYRGEDGIKTYSDPDVELFDEWLIPHASRGTTEEMQKLGQRVYVRQPVELFTAGSFYYLPKWQFHHAWSRSLTITSVYRKDLENQPASLLAKVGHRPVHAFDHPRDLKLERRILALAHAALG